MSLRLAAKFARRELRGGLRGFRLFLACLALGVAAIAAVGSVRSGIEAGLEREGAALLGGDAELELTYRFADKTESAWMRENAIQVSEIAEFRSMAATATDRALTQVKAVDSLYPLIGAVQLEPQFAANRHAPDPRADQADIDAGATHERQRSVRDILMGQARQQIA